MSMIKCPECNSMIDDSLDFCNVCGYPIEKPDEEELELERQIREAEEAAARAEKEAAEAEERAKKAEKEASERVKEAEKQRKKIEAERRLAEAKKKLDEANRKKESADKQTKNANQQMENADTFIKEVENEKCEQDDMLLKDTIEKPFDEPVENKEISNVPKKINKKRSLIIGCIFLLIAFLVLGNIIVKNSDPVKRYLSLIKNDQKDEAQNLYKKKIETDEEIKKRLISEQNVEMDEIYEKFQNQKIDYESAIDKLNPYLGYTASKQYAQKIQNKIKALNKSRDAYKDAMEAEKNGDVKQAVKMYKAVVASDSNYQTAQSKIEVLQNDFKNKLLDEAEDYCDNDQYDDAINTINEIIYVSGKSDELSELKNKYMKLKSEQYVTVEVVDKYTTARDSSNWIFADYVNMVFKITNNADKTIKGIEGYLTVSDLFGKEILTMGCDFTGIELQSKESYYERNLSFECNQFIDSHNKFFNTEFSDLQFMYEVKCIVYTDGTSVTPE